MKTGNVIKLGRTDYKSCWNLQTSLFEARLADRIPDTLLLTEHDHVYTIGKTGNANHLLAKDDELQEKAVSVYFNDRGGDITYHGPGQLVGYPILNLGNYYLDLHRYLRDLEEVIILTLEEYGVTGSRIDGYTGVWVGGNKICAIGVRSSRWVTMHGFAFNINADLSFFDRIIPCGIFEKGVTSLKEILGRPVDLGEVTSPVLGAFEKVFGIKLQETKPELLPSLKPGEVAIRSPFSPALGISQ